MLLSRRPEYTGACKGSVWVAGPGRVCAAVSHVLEHTHVYQTALSSQSSSLVCVPALDS